MRFICDDYFKADFGREDFDVVISFQTLHHFKEDKKEVLFEKIFKALKRGGLYIECDYIACCDEEEQLLSNECERRRKLAGVTEDIFVHFDTPFTLAHEVKLIKTAGFEDVLAVDTINGATFIVAKK